jgi:hypothetical protein
LVFTFVRAALSRRAQRFQRACPEHRRHHGAAAYQRGE